MNGNLAVSSHHSDSLNLVLSLYSIQKEGDRPQHTVESVQVCSVQSGCEVATQRQLSDHGEPG